MLFRTRALSRRSYHARRPKLGCKSRSFSLFNEMDVLDNVNDSPTSFPQEYLSYSSFIAITDCIHMFDSSTVMCDLLFVILFLSKQLKMK